MFPKRLTYGTTFSAIEHTTNENNNPFLNFLQLQKKKKELVVKTRKQALNFDDLKPFFQ